MLQSQSAEQTIISPISSWKSCGCSLPVCMLYANVRFSIDASMMLTLKLVHTGWTCSLGVVQTSVRDLQRLDIFYFINLYSKFKKNHICPLRFRFYLIFCVHILISLSYFIESVQQSKELATQLPRHLNTAVQQVQA